MGISLQFFFLLLGDLMIHNLNKEDAMEYTVDLINTQRQNKGTKTKLIVIRKCDER